MASSSKKKKYDKEYYARHRRKQIEYAKAHQKELTERNRKYIREHKEAHGCMICGEADFRCLSFHHRVPAEKKFALSDALGKRYSIEKIQNEIDKCDVICVNCHFKIHWGDDPYQKDHQS
jgi:hypothetical protein